MAKIKNGQLIGQISTPLLGRIAGRRDGNIQTAEVKSSNPRTAAQMFQRLKMYSSAPLYRVLAEAIALGWENIPQGQSLYNRFTAGAMRSTPYGLRKDLYDKGAGIAWPAQITSGSLPTIAVNGQVSNIAVVGLEEITTATTVAELAKALVESNPGVFEYDDELAFIEVIQTIDSEGVPRLSCTRSAVTLSKDDTETLASIPSLKGFAIDGERLAVKGTPAIGCFAWVHSRMQNGKLLVSSQNLVSNNEMVLKAYSEPAKLRQAAISLGANLRSEKFLKPTTLEGRMALKAFDINISNVKGALGAGEDGIVAVEYAGTPYLVGDEAPILDVSVSNQLIVTVSDMSKLGSTIQCKINGSNVQSPTKDGNTIKMNLPADQDGSPLRTVVVMDPTHTWRLEF